MTSQRISPSIRLLSVLAAFLPLLVLAAVIVIQPASATPARQPTIRFDRDIRPILSNHCFACHGQDAKARKADLRLDRKDDAFAKLRSGAQGIIPGAPLESEIYRRICADGIDPHGGSALPKKQIELIRTWIEEGAEWQTHWAFVPPTRPKVPVVKNTGWPRNAIDRFVLARLEQEMLQPALEADRATLIRRLSFDLLGLPPAPREVDEFVADRSPKAYEKLVDRLFKSPHYGERMAVAWLDAARYGDSAGQNYGQSRTTWPYRDWVVRAFNDNLRFDQFIIQQLAGDLLPNPTQDQLIATGFNRQGVRASDGDDILDQRNRILADQVNTTASAFLGLTFHCAQCHDHHHEPLTMRDYYRFVAFFNKQSDDSADRRHVDAFGNQLPVIDFEWKTGNGVKKRISSMIMRDAEPERETHLPRRGELLTPGVPEFLGVPLVRSDRLGLAQWLTDARHPLTGRVGVNRLWQQFFGVGIVKTTENLGSQGHAPSHPELLDWLAREFVDGGWNVKAMQKLIVLSATYRQSSHATKQTLARHPENRLLARQSRRRLEGEFIRDNALSIGGLLDPHVGGPPVFAKLTQLQRDLYMQERGTSEYRETPGSAQNRRGLYVHHNRSLMYAPFALFDSPPRETCVVRRAPTNTPLQALVLLNEPTYLNASYAMARRILGEAGPTLPERLRFGFRLATARAPTAAELEILGGYYQRQRDDFFAHPSEAREFLQTKASAGFAREELAERAAWTLTCQLLLNMDETISRE